MDNYKRTRILTASPGELLVMLYDGLLQRVRRAQRHLEQGQPGPAGELLGRAQDILHELMSMLDHDKAPELAESLTQLYDYCSSRLLAAVAQQSPEALQEVYDLLRPLRDAWVEAEKEVRGERRVANG